jgi:hypothetical protein
MTCHNIALKKIQLLYNLSLGIIDPKLTLGELPYYERSQFR